MCINRAKCYTAAQEISECDSNSVFITLPSAAGMPLFMFWAKKNEKKDQYKFLLLETYFRIAENAVVVCKNFDSEGKIHFVVALAVSLARSEGSDL